MKYWQLAMVMLVVALTALVFTPAARAEDTVTYSIFSDSVGELAGVEYRDTSGKHLLQHVPLPWTLTVPVVNATPRHAMGPSCGPTGAPISGPLPRLPECYRVAS